MSEGSTCESMSPWGFVLVKSLAPHLAPCVYPSYSFIHVFPPLASCLLPHLFLPPSLHLSFLLSAPPFPLPSSLSAGCRGGSFLFTMSRINLRIREQLFSSLLRQDLGFFQETKTGEPGIRVWGPLSLLVLSPPPPPTSGAWQLSFRAG